MTKEQKIKKRIADLKKLVAQFYEEIDAFEGLDMDSYITPIVGELEENIEAFEKDLAFIFNNPDPDSKNNDTQKGLRRISVDSSMVNAVGYDAREETLYVEFSN